MRCKRSGREWRKGETYRMPVRQRPLQWKFGFISNYGIHHSGADHLQGIWGLSIEMDENWNKAGEKNSLIEDVLGAWHQGPPSNSPTHWVTLSTESAKLLHDLKLNLPNDYSRPCYPHRELILLKRDTAHCTVYNALLREETSRERESVV